MQQTVYIGAVDLSPYFIGIDGIYLIFFEVPKVIVEGIKLLTAKERKYSLPPVFVGNVCMRPRDVYTLESGSGFSISFYAYSNPPLSSAFFFSYKKQYADYVIARAL